MLLSSAISDALLPVLGVAFSNVKEGPKFMPPVSDFSEDCEL